jgi:hypothetical protein
MLVVDDDPDVDELHAAVGEVKPHLSPQGADLGARDVDEALECNMRTVRHSSEGCGVCVPKPSSLGNESRRLRRV